jgi:hypothetical protein
MKLLCFRRACNKTLCLEDGQWRLAARQFAGCCHNRFERTGNRVKNKGKGKREKGKGKKETAALPVKKQPTTTQPSLAPRF